MLNIICGRSGSGKTGAIYNRIKDDVSSRRHAFLIVPEQQSVISEKQIVQLCGNGCNMYLEVLNFTRLSNRVFREYGGMSQKYIDEGGKALILGNLLYDISDSLEQYKGEDGPEFIARLSSQLENVKRRGAAREICALPAQNGFDEILNGKLHDLSLIYTAYNARLHENYSDPTDDLERLCETLDEFCFFEDANVYFDGFFEFCAGELNVIRRILSQAQGVYISLTCSSDLRDDSFEISRATLKKLCAMDENCNVVTLDDDLRSNSNTLKFLKQNLFDDFASPQSLKDGVTVTRCRNIYEECIAVSRSITQLVREKNIRYSDISVALRDPESYRGIIDLYFEKYGIPYFLSAREDITLKPLLSFVFSALECVNDSFRLSSVQRYLKSGLCCLETGDIFELENYILTWNISGRSAWEKPWSMNPDGYGAPFNDQCAQKLEKLNNLRLALSEPVLEMARAMKRQSVRERCEALYVFLSRQEILKKLNEKSDLLREKGDYSAADEVITIWNILMNCLDQMVLIMGDSKISSRRFSELLRLVCSAYSSSRIPSSLDQVQIGEAGHMRTDNIRHTFILGLCEDEFPKTRQNDGLFSEKELKILSSAGIDAGEDAEYAGSREKLFFTLEVSRPSDGLHLMWRVNNMAGEELTKSPFLQRIQTILPEVGEEVFDARTARPVCLCEAFDYLVRHRREDSQNVKELYGLFSRHPDYRDRLKYLETAEDNGQLKPRLSPELLEGHDLYMSQSSFERYINCRYSYFVRDLLEAKPQKRAKFDYSIVGTFVHAVLERFMKQTGGSVREADQNSLDLITDAIVKQYISENLPDYDASTPRFKYLIQRISQTARLTVHSLVDEMRQSKFEPVMLEQRIGSDAIAPYEIALDDGSKLIFKGIVDRIDLYKGSDGRSYVRIMDYKTGRGSGVFKLKDVLNGFKLQMLIYLFSVRQQGIFADGRHIDVVPAGILYVPAVRPKLKEQDVGANREQKIAESFRRSGLILNDPEILYAMEKNPGSVYLPVKFKDGQPAAGESLAALEQFGSLERYICRFAKKNAQLLKSGNIDINPFEYGKDSCEFCENRPVCRFEGNGRRYETAESVSRAWEIIDGED